MITTTRTLYTRASIASPEPEEISPYQNPIEKWKGNIGGIEKTKKLIEMYGDESLKNETTLLNIREMCVKGKIFHPNIRTKFQKNIFTQSNKEILRNWKRYCIRIICLLVNNYSEINEYINEGADKGNYCFVNDENSIVYKFTVLICVLGIAVIEEKDDKIRCDLRDDGKVFNGFNIFKKVFNFIKQKNDTSVSVQDNTIPEEPIGVIKQKSGDLHYYDKCTINSIDNSNKETSGDGAPIGDNNKTKNKKIIINNKKVKMSWLKKLELGIGIIAGLMTIWTTLNPIYQKYQERKINEKLIIVPTIIPLIQNP